MIRRNLPALITLVVLIVAYAICAAQFPAMLSTRVIGDLLKDNAYLGVLAVGMTVVLVSGGIDLSVGSVVAFTGVLVALAVERWGMHPFSAMAMGLALGTSFGAAMGAAIHHLRAPAFIVTLTGMFLARGLCFLLTRESIAIRHPLFQTLAEASVPLPGRGELSLIALVMLAAFVGGAVLLHATRFGANVFAIGGDKRSAELMGTPVGRTTVLVYAFSGFMAALAGVLFAIYTQSGNSLATIGVELDAIAAVVIGGTSLSGGAGGMFGSLFGVLLHGLILTYITFEGSLSSWWARIAIGALLFVFILVQRAALRISFSGGRISLGRKA